MARANGEGSIYRKGDAYEVAIFVDGRRRTSRAATLPRAKAKLRELERKRDAGHTVEDEGITVAVFLERWLTAAEMTVRPRTHKRYAEYVTVHAVPSIGHRRLVELRPVHLQALYTERLASGASPSTVAHLHAVMRRALTMAERWEYVNKNVARQVDPPNVPRYKIRPLTAEEVRRLLVASADNRFEAAIYIAVLTGLRLGEIFALHWSDVAIGDESVVRVRGSLQRIRGKLTIVEPKTRESVRDVALGELGAAALRRQRVRQNAERLRLGVAWEDNDLIFPNVWGRPMAPDYFVRGAFGKLLAAAKLPKVRFHDLRHTFATLQLSGNQPLKIVSEMMGHSRVGITQDLYTHVSARMQRGAASALDDLLRDPNQPAWPKSGSTSA